MGGIGDHHAVEAQLIPEESCHDLRAQGGRAKLLRRNIRVQLLHVLRHQNVAAHNGIQAAIDEGFVHMAVGLHPLIQSEVVDIVGHVGIPVVLAVAGEVLGAGGDTGCFMDAVHIGPGHFRHQRMVISVGTRKHLLALPIVGDIRHRGKGHIAAGRRDLSAGDPAHGSGVLRLSGSTDFHLAGNEGSVHANAASSLLRVAGDKHRNFGVLLQDAVLLQNLRPGHTVIAAAAQMVLFHQFLQIALLLRGCELPEQLSYLLLIRHGGNGFLYPGDVLVTQAIGFCFQVDQIISFFLYGIRVYITV